MQNSQKLFCFNFVCDASAIRFEEIENLGLEEVLFGNGVAVVEWAEKLYATQIPSQNKGLGIHDRIEIKIASESENVRRFDVQTLYMSDRPLPVLPLQ